MVWVAMAVFLPGTGVAFVVVAVFYGPVLAHRVCGAGFSCAARLERKQRVCVLGVWRGAFFSTQSSWIVISKRAPGSPAVTGEMAATAL